MQKAIHIEQSNKDIVRVLSITAADIIENNPTGREYILETYVNLIEEQEIRNHFSEDE